jgi:hypothetical protein
MLRPSALQPAWGKNPFSDPSTAPEEVGEYEIYFTATGKVGYPNELAANSGERTGCLTA